MGFGGPVWHASAVGGNRAHSEAMARRALIGVGDALLGEWVEYGKAVHVRRRLSPREAMLVGEVRDIRGTPEEAQRLDALYRAAPYLRMAT